MDRNKGAALEAAIVLSLEAGATQAPIPDEAEELEGREVQTLGQLWSTIETRTKLSRHKRTKGSNAENLKQLHWNVFLLP